MPFQKIDLSLQALALTFPARFRFACFGVKFVAEATVEGPTCRLAIEADLGPVPFTMESPPARALRLALFKLECGIETDRSFVERNGRLILVTTAALAPNPSARRLVAAAVAQVMRCRPELSLAAETAAVTARRALSSPNPPVPQHSEIQAEPQASAA